MYSRKTERKQNYPFENKKKEYQNRSYKKGNRKHCNIYENKFHNLDEVENSLKNIIYENCFIRKYKKLGNPTLKKLK